MAKYRILSLDGGGIRGLVTAILLERLESEQPGFLDKADLIAGTSTGGILALGLASGLSPTALRDLYEKKGKVIFDDSIWDNIIDLGKLRGAEYGSKGLRRELKKALGEHTKLGDLKKRVMVATFDLDNESKNPRKRSWKPKFFHNFPGPDTDKNALAYKVAMYTSAAPTYFPSVDGYIDGGVFANNPSMAALAQSLDPRSPSPPSIRDIRLLSLGTGTSLTYIKGKKLDWGYVQWVKPLISLMMDGVMGIADYQCLQLLGDNYRRFEPVFPPGNSYPMDDVKKIPDLVRFAESRDLAPALDWIRRRWK